MVLLPSGMSDEEYLKRYGSRVIGLTYVLGSQKEQEVVK